MRMSTKPSVVPMPHSPEEKSRALARVRRVKGQLEALESHIREGIGQQGLSEERRQELLNELIELVRSIQR
jgi:DNA-binding FrmR family transcriptional regulator